MRTENIVPFQREKDIKTHCYFISLRSLLTASGREEGGFFFLLLCLGLIQQLKECRSPFSYSV